MIDSRSICVRPMVYGVRRHPSNRFLFPFPCEICVVPPHYGTLDATMISEPKLSTLRFAPDRWSSVRRKSQATICVGFRLELPKRHKSVCGLPDSSFQITCICQLLDTRLLPIRCHVQSRPFRKIANQMTGGLRLDELDQSPPKKSVKLLIERVSTWHMTDISIIWASSMHIIIIRKLQSFLDLSPKIGVDPSSKISNNVKIIDYCIAPLFNLILENWQNGNFRQWE